MTRDADFKALIRQRMEKTGESYATARDHLLGDAAVGGSSEPAASSAVSTTFSLGTPQARREASARVAALTEKLVGNSGVAVEDGAIHVWYGEPAVFDIRVPLASITDARRLPDGSSGISIGVHGGRGKWLVNEARSGLVRLAINPPVRAELRVSLGLPAEALGRTPFWLKPIMRDRRPRVRELILSVDDPDALLAALGLR